jgi:Xaa-Pro dipeptidase
VDAGATVAGYASDITRTTPAEPGPFADLVDAVEALQLALCDRVRAGIAFPELHREAHAGLGRVLAEAGLVRCSPEAAVEAGITLKFLPHGLGHLIGAQVHDVGGRLAGPDGSETAPPDDFPTLRTTRTLETDMVVTIEPGLYFIPSLLGELRESKAGGEVDWSAVEALVPFGGIRIEDDVRVLAEGHENLTRPAMAAAARTDSP